MADASDYTSLIAREHQKPLFIARVASVVQPFVDIINFYSSAVTARDLDLAVGTALDDIGIWVGVSRNLPVPLVGVFFAWDTTGLGWDQGQWQGPYQSGNALFALADEDYRTLLRAVIAANHWDGTVEGAYAVWAVAFGPLGYTLLRQDNMDMSVDVIVIGPPLSAVNRALLNGGNLGLKSAAVAINGYFKPSIAGQPIFGFDCESSVVSGWDVGNWKVPI